MAAVPSSVLSAAAPQPEYDLSRWNYLDLCDTFSTSMDFEFLSACEEEFHRRQRVKNAWMSKRKKPTAANDERALQPVMQNSVMQAPLLLAPSAPLLTPTPAAPAPTNAQRYFRVVRQRSVWYAHFDGQWIARQMEVYADKPAILLNAGKDDLSMSEMSLDQTGLTRKAGIEILAREFEEEWNRHYGFSTIVGSVASVASSRRGTFPF